MLTNPFRRILPNYIFTYLPILTVMLVNPILYWRTSHAVRSSLLFMTKRFESNLIGLFSSSPGGTTSRFRLGKIHWKWEDTFTKLKIEVSLHQFSILSVLDSKYYQWLYALDSVGRLAQGVCPIRLVLNGTGKNLGKKMIETTLPNLIIPKFQATFNPLQACFNAMVYRKWGDTNTVVIYPWTRHPSSPTISEDSDESSYLLNSNSSSSNSDDVDPDVFFRSGTYGSLWPSFLWPSLFTYVDLRLELITAFWVVEMFGCYIIVFVVVLFWSQSIWVVFCVTSEILQV